MFFSMKTTASTNENRDKRNGQYSHNLDRICKACGHRKGQHEAEAPYAQEDESFGFTCEGFKK